MAFIHVPFEPLSYTRYGRTFSDALMVLSLVLFAAGAAGRLRVEGGPLYQLGPRPARDERAMRGVPRGAEVDGMSRAGRLDGQAIDESTLGDVVGQPQ
jgi:hypothetical protein